MNNYLNPQEKAEELIHKFHRKSLAIRAVDEIIRYSPNKPLDEFDPIEYFNTVKKILKRM